jgi:hypothetical protein
MAIPRGVNNDAQCSQNHPTGDLALTGTPVRRDRVPIVILATVAASPTLTLPPQAGEGSLPLPSPQAGE